MDKKGTKNKNYRVRFRWNAIAIYIFCAFSCVAGVLYINSLKDSIKSQRENIQRNDKVLEFTNELISEVNEAQSAANLFTITDNKQHLEDFNQSIEKIKSINDSIKYYYNDSTVNQILLSDIIELLNMKKVIIIEMSNQYNSFNPYNEIFNLVNNYQPEVKTQKNISIQEQDTIIYKPQKKNFFQRIGDVFLPDNSLDSLVLVSKTTIDTIENIEKDNTIDILQDIKLYTEKGKSEYIAMVQNIEKQYDELMAADQKIAEELADILIILHRQTLYSILEEVQKSEALIDRNINYAIIGGVMALILILTFIFFIFNDVEKVSKAQKATEEAKKKTEEIMESRHKLLLSVSHDIKTPLSSIMGNIELLQMDNNELNNNQRIISMKRSSEHILELLSNLLNYSSLDQGKQVISRTEFNISKMCDDIKNMFMPIIESKHLSLHYHKKIADDMYVISDALKIKQILCNILSNATKYTIEGEIHFGVYNNDNKMIFSIIDQGVGIPEERMNDIFKPFSRIEKNSELSEGSGFGLYVVKGMIELLNGKISVKSKVNYGTHIEVQIPVKISDGSHNTEETTVVVCDKKHLNILIIDDDNSLLTVTKAMLDKLGHHSDICLTSVEFNKYLDKLDFYDVILTDREMGTYSGNDVLNIIKNINPDKKVILMTARSEYNHRKTLAEGFDGYLEKPFSINDIATILNCPVTEEEKQPSVFADEFPELCSIFGDDESIQNILQVFADTTADNLITFNTAVNNDDYMAACNLCHRMSPMFVQLEKKEMAAFLNEMDIAGKEKRDPLPDWKSRSLEFINQADDFLNHLYEKYGIT